MRRIVTRGWIGLVAALFLAPAAGALNITGLAITPTVGTNTANFLQNSGQNPTQIASATSIVIAPSGPVADTFGSNITFETRYASSLTADRESANATFTQNQTSNYSITFTVDNPAGETYQIDISTLRVGALTIVSDDAGNGSLTLGAVTGSVDAIVDGALALAAVPFTSSTTATSTFSQPGSTLTITDSALTRSFTLNFNWQSSATSTRDEASIRMGVDGSVNPGSGTTADNYSFDGRSLSGDGHFVTVSTTMISAPEPASGALVAFGLLGLALRAHGASERRR